MDANDATKRPKVVSSYAGIFKLLSLRTVIVANCFGTAAAATPSIVSHPDAARPGLIEAAILSPAIDAMLWSFRERLFHQCSHAPRPYPGLHGSEAEVCRIWVDEVSGAPRLKTWMTTVVLEGTVPKLWSAAIKTDPLPDEMFCVTAGGRSVCFYSLDPIVKE